MYGRHRLTAAKESTAGHFQPCGVIGPTGVYGTKLPNLACFEEVSCTLDFGRYAQGRPLPNTSSPLKLLAENACFWRN
jgi:hypothetical protein